MPRAASAWTLTFLMAALPAMANDPMTGSMESRARLRPVGFENLDGWRRDDHLAAWRVFIDHCRAITSNLAPLRSGVSASSRLKEACALALARADAATRDQARERFESLFAAHEIIPIPGANPHDHGFLTGYYEPVVSGSLVRTPRFREKVLGRPSDLLTWAPDDSPPDFPKGLTGARIEEDGRLAPYADRAAIDRGDGAHDAPTLLYVRDGVELFMMQVQGSARVRLPDGRLLRLTYAGRNGQPYTSIGRLLVERGHVAAADMSLARLKGWVRAKGQEMGEAGRALLQENKSYVFFRIDESLDAKAGPIGAASIALTKLRSIAVDRTLWPYGLPIWIDAELPWRQAQPESFQRLMIAQDTGSAIVGAARADIFFGTGDRAGRLAGGIRHSGRMFALLPRQAASAP